MWQRSDWWRGNDIAEGRLTPFSIWERKRANYCSTLKVEAVDCPEILLFIYQTTLQNTRNFSRNTNKMQLCNRIYYSKFYWRLNMFRAAYRSSSEALTVFAASGLHTHVVTDRSQEWVGTGQFPLILGYGRSPHAYVNQRLQMQLELLMMSGMPLETCWAFNERWNNKFYYKVASCWLFLLSHTAMHGSTNIKKNPESYFS